MTTREKLVKDVRTLLARTGFFMTDPKFVANPVFDLVARRDASLVVIKCVLNAYTLSKQQCDQLVQVAHLLRGSPLVVSSHSARGELLAGVIYLHYRAPVISFKSLREYLVEGVPPFAFAGPGGYFVPIDSSALRRARAQRKLSLDALAREVGVSRRSIQLYEEGMSAAAEAADRLERFFGDSITLPLDPFSYHVEPDPTQGQPEEEVSDFEAYVWRALEGLGYRVTQAARCPFDAILETRRERILSGVAKRAPEVTVRARHLADISQVAETEAVMFVENRIRTPSVAGMPVVTREDLEKADAGDEIIEMIKKRKRAGP